MGVATSTACCRSASDKYDASGLDAISGVSDEKIALGSQAGSLREEPLSADETRLVQETWRRVVLLGPEKVGVILFKNIFKLAPEALQLFPFKAEPNILTYETPRLKVHAVRVVGTVGMAVQGLQHVKSLAPQLQELGLRHCGYGVREPHYDVVGKALMMTLESAFREAFSPKVRLAWTKVWHLVSSTMLSGSPEADTHPQVQEPKTSPKTSPVVQPSGKLLDSELALIRQSWTTAVPAGGEEAVGVTLFRNIFGIAPDARQLFSFRDEADIYSSPRLKSHATKVISTVDLAVAGLDKFEDLVETLQSLGLRHSGYGVLPAHYDVVGQALIKTLKDGLGKAFTPELESAWVKVWVIVSTTMMFDIYY